MGGDVFYLWTGISLARWFQGESIRVVSEDGELIAQTTIDLTKGYQKMRKPQ
jgi:hypothetical protein